MKTISDGCQSQFGSKAKINNKNNRLYIVLAIPEGLEPPTPCLEGKCSILLSYGTGARTLPLAAVYVNRPESGTAHNRIAR
jgi:hypothetical protein